MADHSSATNKCPICKKDTVEAFKPFCSKRCANVDLFNWLKGEYALPTDELPTEKEFDPFEALERVRKAH